MTMPSLIWGSPQWMTAALVLLGVAAAAILWSYARATTKRSVRIAAAILKALGFTALAISLLDPLLTGTRPRRGANAFVILADNSQSLQIRDDNATGTRGDWMRDLLRQESPWRTRLGQDYDVRGYVFDTHLRAVDGFDGLDVRRHWHFADGIARRPLEAVPRLAAGRRASLHRRQPDRRGRRRLVGVAADLSRRPSVARRGEGRRRQPDLDQPDQFRVGPGRHPGRRPTVGFARQADRRRRRRRGRQGSRTPADARDRRRQTAELSVPVSPRAQRA